MNILDQLLKDYLKSNDSGRIFTNPVKPIYIIIGWLHLLLPLFILKLGYEAFADKYGFSDLRRLFHDYTFIIVFVLMILFAAACLTAYLAIKLWTDRANRADVLIKSQNEFCVLPIITTYVRNQGEGNALVILIMGIAFSLAVGLGLVFLAVAEKDYFAEIFKHAMTVLFGGIIVSIIVSYLTLVLHRFISEAIGLFVSIASNVSRIANKN